MLDTAGWKPEEVAALRELEAVTGRRLTTEPLGPAPGDVIPDIVTARLALRTADLLDEYLSVVPLENDVARRRVAAAFGDLLELLTEDL
jgi:hypothetical protein